MLRPHVQVILAGEQVPGGLRSAIQQTGATASFRPLSSVLRDGVCGSADANVVVVPDQLDTLVRSLRVLLDRIADRPRATLLLRASGGAIDELPHPRTVPVTFGCGLGVDELTTRLTTMIAMRDSLDSLHRCVLASRQMEQTATRRYQTQLRLARQVQRELIPDRLPSLGRVRFRAVFRPTEYVSGDIYDVHRLDEDHVAIALADATGHGIPAALLTVFIKRALRGKEVQGGSYRILQPDEVLARLNEELLDAELSDCSFIAVTYGVLNVRTLTLRLARAGSPYPILRRASGTLRLLRPMGGVVGVMPDAQFGVQTVQLAPGDSLLICSDGVESLMQPPARASQLADTFANAARAATHDLTSLLDEEPEFISGSADDSHAAVALATLAPPKKAVRRKGRISDGSGGDGRDMLTRVTDATPPAAERLLPKSGLAPDEALLASSWCDAYRTDGPEAALDHLGARYDTLRRMGTPLDDLTALALDVLPD